MLTGLTRAKLASDFSAVALACVSYLCGVGRVACSKCGSKNLTLQVPFGVLAFLGSSGLLFKWGEESTDSCSGKTF